MRLYEFARKGIEIIESAEEVDVEDGGDVDVGGSDEAEGVGTERGIEKN